PRLLRRGVSVRDGLTRRTAHTVLGPDAPKSVAGGHTSAESERSAARISLRASSRAAHASRASLRGAVTATRCDDCPDRAAPGNLCPEGASTDAQHAAALDRDGPDQSPARPATLCDRPPTGCCGACSLRASVQQWTDGGPGNPAQAPQTPDVWPSQVG